MTDKKEEQNHEELIEIEEAVTDLFQCGDPKPFHNVNEGRKIARKKLPLKKRRSVEADSGHYPTIDLKEVKLHSRFKGLLGIDEDLEESISADMAVEGFKLSKPIVLATWPGQEEPVLIDGHTRLKSAKSSGIKKIPYAIEKFDDIDGALEYVATAQTKRRGTDQWVLYQLIVAVDNLMDRGGDRRSDKAKSKGPTGPIETLYKNSAERTAFIVKTDPTTVKRARRIQREGTREIIQALKDRKLKISQAEKAIIKAKTKKTDVESEVIQNKDNMVSLTDENLAGLEKLGGNRHEHVNAAVKGYIARELPKKAGSESENSEVDDQKPLLIQ